MNLKSTLLVLILNMVPSIRSLYSEDPLIFNPYTLEIYDLKSLESNSYDGLLAIACPAQTLEQREFNRKVSLDGKALFVQDVLKKEESYLYQIRCTFSYEMAVVYHKVENQVRLLEFGYEVYYKRSRVQENFIQHRFDIVFGAAEEMDSNWERIKQFSQRPMLEEVEVAQRFVWISKVKFLYNRSDWSVEFLSYSMKIRLDQLKTTCKNDNLGIRLYEERKLDDFYLPENQEKIFSKVNLPPSADGICRSQYKCFNKYNLVAPYRFQTHISRPIECSNLTSIPIWYRRTRELLDFTEKFIIALAQTFAEKRIQVLTGLHGQLTLQEKSQKYSKPIPIYLDSGNNKLPVPKIVYKIVSSIKDDCDPSKFACRFDMVIVIHNEPEENQIKTLCQDICQSSGWESVQYLSTTNKNKKSPFIYCCELDKELQEKLAYTKELTSNRIFSLKTVWTNNEKNGLLNDVSSDRQTEVENKMNEIFTPKLYSILGLLP